MRDRNSESIISHHVCLYSRQGTEVNDDLRESYRRATAQQLRKAADTPFSAVWPGDQLSWEGHSGVPVSQEIEL